MRISDWSSDVCSSDLQPHAGGAGTFAHAPAADPRRAQATPVRTRDGRHRPAGTPDPPRLHHPGGATARALVSLTLEATPETTARNRSEEHTSELQSLMRISYAVFCLKKKTKNTSQQ